MAQIHHEAPWTDRFPLALRVALWPLVTAGIGTAATKSSVNSWFTSFDKPDFNPPGWLFGPVWPTLYLLMGIADYVASKQGGTEQVGSARALYRVQMVLNGAWSVLFFGLRSPLAALVEIVFLWVAILLTVVAFARVSKLAALLLVPYLPWTSFSAVLNAEIWRKNQ